MEDLHTDEADFQQLLDELTDAKNHLVQHNGYLPRQWFLATPPDCRFRKQARYRQNVGWQRLRWKRTRRSEKMDWMVSRPMRGEFVP